MFHRYPITRSIAKVLHQHQARLRHNSDFRMARPPWALALPLKSQDFGASRCQLADESTSAPSPDN
jgi:hypothetical protein